MIRFFSRGQPLKANIRFRIVGKILCIALMGNDTVGCQFSGSLQLHEEVR